MIRRLVPTRATWAVLVGLLSTISFGAVRDFVWADLREGMVNLRCTPPGTRALVRLGFALLFAMTLVLLFNDFLRTLSPLLPLSSGSPGRGTAMPLSVVPATVFALSVAWSFLLTGALHARRTLRLATLLLYLTFAVIWTRVNTVAFANLPELALAWSVVLAVPVFFAVRWRARSRTVLEFAVLLALVAPTFVLAQTLGARAWRFSGIPLVFGGVDEAVGTLSILVTPLLLLIGLDIAEFVYRASGWTSEIASSRLPRVLLGGVLALVFAWQLYAGLVEMSERAGRSSLGEQALSYAGALGIPLAVGVVWWIFRRTGSREALAGEEIVAGARGAAPGIVLAYYGLSAVLFAVLMIGFPLASLLGLTDASESFLGLGDAIRGWVVTYRVLVDVAALGAALYFYRRDNRVLAFYLGILGAVNLWLEAVELVPFLGALNWSGTQPTALWWAIVFGAFALFWAARGRLTALRMRRLLLLFLAAALLGQTGFIEDPFSPFFGFTGIGLIALGVIWDALTLGSWANSGTVGLPRTSRIFLYLGYVLFSVTVINWAVTVHDLSQVSTFTGEGALEGFNLLGKPLLYAIFAVTLALPPEEVGDARGGDGGPEE